MIRVCDAIMGSGKSMAAINFMNEHPDKRFIYITPYIEEAHRIAALCDKANFYEPQKMKEFGGSKVIHTANLVSRGENVSTTHQAFKSYSKELLDDIKEKKYTLIIDENVDILEATEEPACDIQMAIDAGYLKEVHSNVYGLAKETYDGGMLKDLFTMMRTRNLVKVEDSDGIAFFYCQLPPELIMAFEDVYILTYMFEGQGLCNFMKLYDIQYTKIGIENDGGVFRFSDNGSYVPEYVRHLPDMIHILDNKKMNSIGDSKYAISMNWFKRHPSEVKQLKNNLYNFFRNISDAPSEERMWSTYAEDEFKIRGKGYSKGFVPYNKRAINTLSNKTVAAYCVNIFMNVGQKLFYHNVGVEVNEDMYALSTMVQWIWRTAIRNGKEIELYIPSKRMRTLLTDWITEVSSCGKV